MAKFQAGYSSVYNTALRDERAKYYDAQGRLKEGLISSPVRLEGYDEVGSIIFTPKTYYGRAMGAGAQKTFKGSSTYFYKDPRAQQQQQQQAFQQQQAEITARTQEDIARQLQIVQTEKSAVAKMQEDYANMLKQEADARLKAQQEADTALRVSTANQARGAQAASLQIQPASGTPQTAGTEGFKRRQRLPMISQQKGALSSLNIQTPSLLNI